MRPVFVLAAAVCVLVALPAAGQDLLKPLQDLVEGVSPKRAASPPKKSVPEAAPQPQERPQAEAPETAPQAEEEEAVPLPVERPDHPAEEETAPAESAPAEPDGSPETPAAGSDEPAVAEDGAARLEPGRVYQTMCPALMIGLVEGEMRPPIDEDGCEERSPVAVTGVLVNGRMVPLSGEAITSCQMAGQLPAWLSAVDNYAASHDQTRLESVTVGTSYACRNRNNESAGFMSEHGFANALDVVGFRLEDGRSVGVEGDWGKADASEGRLLRFAHDAACAGFSTVLGPEANPEHHDHLHLDMGCHGKTCTARLCQ